MSTSFGEYITEELAACRPWLGRAEFLKFADKMALIAKMIRAGADNSADISKKGKPDEKM